jgi:hypothetical protein
MNRPTVIRAGDPELSVGCAVEVVERGVYLVEWMTGPPCDQYTGTHIQAVRTLRLAANRCETHTVIADDKARGGWTRCDTCGWPAGYHPS